MMILGSCGGDGATSFHLTQNIGQSDICAGTPTDQLITIDSGSLQYGDWYLYFARTRGDFVGTPDPECCSGSVIDRGFGIEVYYVALGAVVRMAWAPGDCPDDGHWSFSRGGIYVCGNTMQLQEACWNPVYGPCPDPAIASQALYFDISYFDPDACQGYPFTIDIYGQMTPFTSPP